MSEQADVCSDFRKSALSPGKKPALTPSYCLGCWRLKHPTLVVSDLKTTGATCPRVVGLGTKTRVAKVHSNLLQYALSLQDHEPLAVTATLLQSKKVGRF